MNNLKKNKAEIVAYSRYIRMSPFKIRRIIDQIRGRSCNESLMILKFMSYKACPIITKTILSALANAKQTLNIDDKFLYIYEARVDEGPALKRFCPHAQGRGFPIKKRFSHITIKLKTM